MTEPEEDKVREDRIDAEVIVDAYSPEEQALGWYYYLDRKIKFPFKAKWVDSPNSKGKTVKVLKMPPEEDCMLEMFVEIRYKDKSGEDEFSVRLAEIQPIDVDPNTEEAIADWHYWVEMDYEF
ncbi:MAG: calcium-binding protein [Microcoleaceae cyanobacterium]